MRKYNIDDDYFNEINSEQKAYILGLLYADGCVYSSERDGKWAKLDLIYTDKNLLEKIAKEMNNECPIKRYTYDKEVYFKNQNKTYNLTQDMCRLSFRSSKIVDNLIKLGCSPSKTFKITFPSENIIPSHLMRHFLRGYLDGDGSISASERKSSSKYRKTYLHFSVTFTGTSSLVYSIKEYINNNVVKFVGDIRSRWNNGKDNYTLAIDGNCILEKILDWLYYDATIYLERKYEKYLLLKEEICNKNKSLNYSYQNRNIPRNEPFNIYKNSVYIGTSDNRRKFERESELIVGIHISRVSFTKCLNHECDSYKGFKFIFVSEDKEIKNPNYICCGKSIMIKGIKINQYDLDGKYIKTWNSTKEIAKELDITLRQTSSILSCCKHNQKTAFGYIWRYFNENN